MRTLKYTLRRLTLVMPQMFLISIVTFVLVRLLPGDPARLQLGPLAPQSSVDALRRQMRLDSPIYDQYLAYLRRIVHGDFGQSWVNSNDSVASDLRVRIPATLELITYGLFLSIVILVPLGMITAARGGNILTRVLKKITMIYGLLAGALPDFWLGLIMIFVFFTKLKLLPGPEGRLGIGDSIPPHVTGAYTVDAAIAGQWGTFASACKHLVLPVLTLAFVYGGAIFKMTRSTMTTALRSPYMTYTEGFGVSHTKLLWHAFRNAAPPVIVLAGTVSGYLLGGAVLIETVFNLNGVGQYAVQSIVSADYAPIQAFVLVAALFTMLVYLLVDLIYFAADPRIRVRQRER